MYQWFLPNLPKLVLAVLSNTANTTNTCSEKSKPLQPSSGCISASFLNYRASSYLRSSGIFGLKNEALHHFLHGVLWEIFQQRSTRLGLVKRLIGNQPIVLCINETGGIEKGQVTN